MFSQQIRRFSEKAMLEARDFKRGVGIKLFGAVIKDTPRLTGRAAGNWQITLNSPASGDIERFGVAGSLADASDPQKHGQLKDVVYLTNNLPYIHGLEYGASKIKAPEGMVRRNVARFKMLLARRGRR